MGAVLDVVALLFLLVLGCGDVAAADDGGGLGDPGKRETCRRLDEAGSSIRRRQAKD